MYEVIKNVIRTGNYDLINILGKIDTMWLQGRMSEEQRLELVEMARKYADPANSYAPLQAQIDALADRIAALESKAEPADPADPEDPANPSEEYPAYVPPTGGHDAYHSGDKMTFNGKRYVCIAPDGVAVVWDPKTFPSYWQEVSN